MIRSGLALAALLAAHATAFAGESLTAVADAPDNVRDATDVSKLTLHDEVMIDSPGATAAFSVDPTVAEATASDGRVTIIARGLGTTTISVVTATGILTYPLTVVARPHQLAMAADDDSNARSWTQWQGQYESSSARLTNSLEMVDGTDRRTLRAYGVNVVRTDRSLAADDVDARASFPALSLEWKTPRREIVLLDKTIEHSPLTLQGVTVRGAHVRSNGLELHAGVTSPVLYQDVFLTTQRELVLGASYDIALGARSSLTPNVYAFPSPPQTGGTSGAMGSLLYRYRTHDDHLKVAAELGWGGVVGGGGELTYQDATNRVWLTARHQPRGFAALGIGRPLGSMLDAMWTSTPTKRFTVNTAVTAARYEVGPHDQDVVTAMFDTRTQVARHVATSFGVSSGQFGDAMQTVRSITVPVGLHVDGAHVGASAIYRYQTNSARNLGGHGGRLSLRANVGTFHASAFADAQQEAASVDLILRDEPVLAQTLAELGLTASSPDDLARLLRENAQLAQLGYLQDSRLDFDPWRVQAGADLAWLSRDKSRQQLRFRVLANRTRSVADREDTDMASLSYAQRLAHGIDATGMVTLWSRTSDMTDRATSWSVAAGMRVRFDSVPRLTSRPRTITGVVVTQGAAPMPGVIVRLDNGRTARSDAAGRFELTDVDAGPHQVEAELPDGAYFVTASRLTAYAGAPVRFVLATAPAHITGFVRDDTGAGIAAVSVTLHGSSGDRDTSTDSSGRFQFAVSAGDYELTVRNETLPAGYDTSALAPAALHVEQGEPEQTAFVARANRSVAGRLRGAPAAVAAASIRIVELDLPGVIDAAGRFVFRKLPPGTFTVEATIAGTKTRRTIELPLGPATIRDVDFP